MLEYVKAVTVMVLNNHVKKWLKAAGIRAIKTFAQSAAAMIGVSTTIGSVDWVAVGSASLLAAVLSLLMSVAGLPELKEENNNG